MSTRPSPVTTGRPDRFRALLPAIGLTLAGGGAVILGTIADIRSESAAIRSATNVLRAAATIGGGYVLTMIAIGALVRILHAPAWIRRKADRVTPLLIRRVLDISMATGIVMSATVVGASATPAHRSDAAISTSVPSVTSAPAAGSPRPTLAGRLVTVGDPSSGQRWPNLPDPPAETAGPTVGATTSPSSRPTATPTPSTIRRTTPDTIRFVAPTELPAADPPPALAVVVPLRTRIASGPAVPPRAADRTVMHTVRPGESFWSIAEDHVLAENPTADEVAIATYWRHLIRANADRLPVRGQPDVLFAGIVLHVPQVTHRQLQPATDRTSRRT